MAEPLAGAGDAAAPIAAALVASASADEPPAAVPMEATVVRPGWAGALWKFLWIGLTSFGLGRQVYLYDAFVDSGWIPPELFLADYAKTMVLPGAAFVNITVMCGLRLGGIPMAVAGTTLVFLPGTVAIILAAAFLSTSDPRVAALMYGILVGAVALLVSMVVRLSRNAVTTPPAAALALGAMGLTVLNVPLLVTILVVGTIGIWWHRPRANGQPGANAQPDASTRP